MMLGWKGLSFRCRFPCKRWCVADHLEQLQQLAADFWHLLAALLSSLLQQQQQQQKQQRCPHIRVHVFLLRVFLVQKHHKPVKKRL